jgi:hypothetical protein
MKLTTLILVCAISLSLALEEPTYTVIQKLGNNMEIRKYAPSKWVTTQVDERASNFKNSMMLNNLFKYISGANSDKQKMKMTAPVVMSYVSKNNKTINKDSEVTAYMSFYIPSKFKNNTPKPSVNNVVIRELPEFVAAVVRLEGIVNFKEYTKNRDDLVKRLGSDAKSYDTANMVTASNYLPIIAVKDTPFMAIIKNEVWIPKM